MSVDQSKIAVKKAMAIWALDEVNEEEWKPYATKRFYEQAIKEIKQSHDDKKRDITSLEIFATEPILEDEMRFVIFADWQLLDGVKTVNTQRKMYYTNVVQIDGKWYVDDIEGLEKVFINK
ncbi:hypothetical protein ACA29_02900 [Lederbergia galactosidilytica]|uniref:Uncharacterized protein n=1 Tax=Lederbergia galactosidilytica TaxID=217031 RepID=A0A0Q9Y7K9_9BACI|nr:hypothetical protein ACA29_02900 [Lederbergia galactosidilytica]